jgi:ABC-type branched-subunit amino acid transport system ATPase component
MRAENLIWIDLEMTGLDTGSDTIIEIATIVTDKNLNELAVGPVMAIGQSRATMDEMDEWNTRQHGQSGLVERVLRSDVTLKQGESATLELEAMAATFGGVRAVDDVALRVAPGEIVGLIGPNGAGKTTLFDLVSGFVPDGTGRVVLDGVDISSESAPRRAAAGLGRSFQDAHLFPSLTVEEAIAAAMERFVAVRDPITPALRLPAAFDSEAAVAARTDELIDVFGLEAFRTKFVRELSTGSRRIVDLACVAAHRPTVVLLDEPSSGIAQREAEALAPLLRRLRDGLGASLVVIDHDLTLLASVADRLVAMDQGRIIAEGSPRDVLAAPEVITAYLGPPDSRQHRSNAPIDHETDPAAKA